MTDTQPIGQNSQSCCALPTPAKWVGGIVSFASLVGFGAAAHFGKLDRRVALVGVGLSGVSLAVFGCIPSKVQVKESEESTVEEKKTLCFREEFDTLEKLLTAIDKFEGLQVLDLSEMPDKDDFFVDGRLLLAIAKHEKLESVLWGSKEVGVEAVDTWTGDLLNGTENKDLEAYLGRTDSIRLPNLNNNFSLLPKLAERANLKWAYLLEGDAKSDWRVIFWMVRKSLAGHTELSAEEKAFLKLLPSINGETWQFEQWNEPELLQLLNACPNLRSLDLTDVTDKWTKELAEKVQELLTGGCKVSARYADELARERKDAPDSDQFKAAAAMCQALIPNDKWTTDELLALIPQMPNFEWVLVKKNLTHLFTPAVIDQLKERGITKLGLSNPTLDDLKVFQALSLQNLALRDARRLDDHALEWIAREMAPNTIALEDEWPPGIEWDGQWLRFSSDSFLEAYPRCKDLDLAKQLVTLIKKAD